MPEICVITKGKDLLQIGPKEFRDFIAPFIREKAFLNIQKVPTMDEQKKWVKARAKEMDQKLRLKVLLLDDGYVVGDCDAFRKSIAGEEGNVHFGLTVSRAYRGKGWGEKLLRMTIREARRRFKPHRMWIEHMDGNRPARRLYQKVGFVEIARLDGYHNHFGRRRDKVLMQYKGRER